MPLQTRAHAALLLFALVAPGMLAAQQPSARDTAIVRLQAGQQVRLAVAGTGRLTGRVGVATIDTLDLAQDDAVRRIPIPAVDTLWVRSRATTTGLIVGGAVGAAFGGLAGAYGSGICEYDCVETGSAVLTGGLLGAVVGAGVGALIGAIIPKWKRTYP
jgi:hypothetical protein